MKTIMYVGAVALALSGGYASAQTSSETTQQTYAAPAAPAVPVSPPAGVLSTERTVRATDADGNQFKQKQTTYRDGNGVAQDSTTTTSTAAPPPPPVTTTSTTTDTSTTAPQ